MNDGLSLHVNEVLRRPIFKKARLVAGHDGLHRRIRWVHVLETTEVETLIHGEEMILSTGIGFSSDIASCLAYLRKLIDLHASCLCIEMGKYFDRIPEEMIHMADESAFPVIIFPEKVRFVDITQDLHASLINQHYQRLHELEKISREFHRLTLTSQGIYQVLKLLYQSSKLQVVYYPLYGQSQFVPRIHPNDQEALLQFIQDHLKFNSDTDTHGLPYEWKYRGKSLLLQPVGAMGQTWAYVGILSNEPFNEFGYLMLDSASISIAQEWLRKRYMEEKKNYAEHLWVSDLLNNQIKQEDQLQTILGSDYHKLNQTPYHVCVIEIENLYSRPFNSLDDEIESTQFHLSAKLRSLFEQHSFQPLITVKNNRMDVIANDLGSSKSPKQRLHQVFQSFQRMNWDPRLQHLRFRIGVGELYTQLHNAHLSYQEAMQALFMSPYIKKEIIFYDDLGIYQLLMRLREGNSLEFFVQKHLGPLIEEDQAKGSALLATLKAFLDNNCSKQLTAQKLSIVRQTLYYRLEKISELLGYDLSSPERRITLQVAFLAYRLLQRDIV